MARSSIPRIGLDRAAVVRAAAQLVNQEGAQALTINRLARELGVQPPSLYNHIDNLADLWRELALLSISGLGERLIGSAVGQSGPAGVRSIALAYRAYVKEFPELYQASLRASRNQAPIDPRLQAAEDRVVQPVLAIVASFDLTGEAAIHAVRALRSMIHGFTTLEVAGGFGLPVDLDESFNRLIDLIVHGLEQERGVKDA